MIILFAILGYVILGAVVVVLLFSRTRLKENIHSLTARYERVLTHLTALEKAARRGEERCKELVGTTQQALGVAQQIETVGERVDVVGQHVRNLITYVTQPELDAPAPRHALASEYHHDLNDSHDGVSIANGTIHYVD